MLFVPKWVILLGSVGRMYSRVRFSRWLQKLSGTRGGVAAAGTLAAVLAVLLGFGAAGAFTAPGPGTRVSATAAAGAAGAVGGSGPAGAQPAGSGSRAPSAPAAASSGTSGSGGTRPGAKSARTKPRSTTPRSSESGTSSRGPSRAVSHSAANHGAANHGAASHGTVPAGAAAANTSGTSCRSVAHIGDSTSVGLVSPLDLPDPAQRLAAQYRDVGVRHSWIDASGGRSMVEEMPGQVNGYGTARNMASRGFRGCWVIALGTNDTANVSVGSSAGRMARIQELMSVAHGAPVMWVNVKTLDPSGPWSEANMQIWNDTLRQACHQYPNLRIFDWASAAQDGWFISDGIHYTSAGYAARAHLIARALARAFPRSGSSTSCVIH
ncbi:MAG: hypothetical protein QOG05_510 [Streptosporangiaceae bacterium]|nr:hypothetical protein [Streptosporangiaceae bacterium]